MTVPPYAYDLFISFAPDDEAWVLGYLLPALNLPAERIISRTIFDLTQSFALGVPEVAEFDRAVRTSRYTLLILTPAFQADRQAEFGALLASHLTAAGEDARVIPLLLKPCALPPRVDFLVKLDCTDEIQRPAQMDRLRRLLGSRAIASESSAEPGSPVPGAVRQGHRFAPEPAGLPYSAAWYVQRRKAEAIACARLTRSGGSVTALCGAEGFGKRTLLGRITETIAQEKPAGRVMRADLGKFDMDSFRATEDFLFELAQHLLGSEPIQREAADYLNRWHRRPGTPQGKIGRLLQRFLLPGAGRPLLVIESLDLLLEQAPESSFLDLLRSWAEDEQVRILVLATTDFFPVTAQGTSPFLNVTERLPVSDLSGDEVRDLGRLYRISLRDGELRALQERLGGHPYLLRCVLFDAAVRERKPEESLADSEIFATYLGRLQRRLRSNPELEQALAASLRGAGRVSRAAALRLEGLGLIKRTSDGYRLRYPLYQQLVP